MKRTLTFGALAAVLLAVFAGAAYAVNKVCPETGTCRGTEQADGLTGTNGINRILGLGGDDVVYAYGANDVVYGGFGNDFIRGDAGADQLYGEPGLDSVIGSGGGDTLNGGAGTDNVAGGPGNDTLYGAGGNDLMGNIVFGPSTVTDTGQDKFYGGDGDDRFYTSDGEVDTINCGPGEDTVYKDEIDVLANDSCENIWNKVERSEAANERSGFQEAGKAAGGAPSGARAVR